MLSLAKDMASEGVNTAVQQMLQEACLLLHILCYLLLYFSIVIALNGLKLCWMGFSENAGERSSWFREPSAEGPVSTNGNFTWWNNWLQCLVPLACTSSGILQAYITGISSWFGLACCRASANRCSYMFQLIMKCRKKSSSLLLAPPVSC